MAFEALNVPRPRRRRPRSKAPKVPSRDAIGIKGVRNGPQPTLGLESVVSSPSGSGMETTLKTDFGAFQASQNACS